jgi:hypothetical protein
MYAVFVVFVVYGCSGVATDALFSASVAFCVASVDLVSAAMACSCGLAASVCVALVLAAMACGCGLVASVCGVVVSEYAVQAPPTWWVGGLRLFHDLVARLAVRGTLGFISVLSFSLGRRGSLASALLGRVVVLSGGRCKICVLGFSEAALLVVESRRKIARLGSMSVHESFVDDSTINSTATWGSDVIPTASEERVPRWWPASTFLDAYKGFAFPAGHYDYVWV